MICYNNRKILVSSYLILVLTLLIGCANPRLPGTKYLSINELPFVHKIDIQQGNVITQDMLGSLEQGMDKKRIKYIMGTPSIRDTFNYSTWDYFFSHRFKDEYTESRRITLHFDDNEKLAFISGNVQPSETTIPIKKFKDVKVSVPRYKQLTAIQRFKNKIPFTEKTEAKTEEDEKVITKEYLKFEEMVNQRKKQNSDIYVGIKPSPDRKALESKEELEKVLKSNKN